MQRITIENKIFNQAMHTGVFILILTTLLSFFIGINSPKTRANTPVVSPATIRVAESCSMSGTVTSQHTATLLNGTYSNLNYPNGIGSTELRAFCNDSAGFAIYAIGFSKNEYGNTMLYRNDSNDPTDAISTGLYTAGSTVNSTWSMKLASVSGAYAPTIANGTNGTEDFTTWHVVPDEYTKVAYRSSGTDLNSPSTGIGSSLIATYDAYISSTQPHGTYIGQVKYTLVHPNKMDDSNRPPVPLDSSICPAYSICYAPNAGDIKGTMVSDDYNEVPLVAIAGHNKAAIQSATFSYDTYGYNNIDNVDAVTLIAPNFSRAGFGFAGWSTDFDATNDSIIYGPNETVSIDVNNGGLDISSSGLILYPVWIEAGGKIQGWNGCNILQIPPTNGNRAKLHSMTALRDERDDNVYAIARLADGKCWMVENLRLSDDAIITPSNTQSSGGSFGGVFAGLAKSEDANFGSASTTPNSLYSVDGSGGTINIGSAFSPAFRFPRYNNNNINVNGKDSAGRDLVPNYDGSGHDGLQWYSYGNYYSWAATIADTSQHIFNNAYVANTSICPSGWRLPEGGDKNNKTESGAYKNEFLNLSIVTIGAEPGNTSNQVYPYYFGNIEGANASNIMRTFPNNFIYSGNWYNLTAIERNISGSYWSGSSRNSTTAYSVSIDGGSLRPSRYILKDIGYSVRCILGI